MSLRNRTAKRLFVTNVTGLLLECFVVSSLKLMFSGLFQKDLFKGGLSLEEPFFQSKLLSRLSHKVCRPLSSPVSPLRVRERTKTNSTQTRRGSRDLSPGDIGGKQVLSPLHHPCTPCFHI